MSGSETEDLVIGSLTSIGRIGVENEEIDVTTLDSADGYKKFIAGFKDAGELPLAGIIEDEADIVAMKGLADSQSTESWEINFPSGSKWAFDGFMKLFEEAENTPDGVRNFNATIRISGKPVYTGGSASA
jgi:predicted secreted protein